MSSDFKILCHHVYEYHKGLRSLVLHTMHREEEVAVRQFLSQRSINYFIQVVTPQKINVFFGDAVCVAIVRRFGTVSLSSLSAEEDFMLGIMLGYDRQAQCERYVRRCGMQPVPQTDSADAVVVEK